MLEAAPGEPNREFAVPQFTPPPKVHPVGATMVIDVMAYAFEDGFVTVTRKVCAGEFVPPKITLGIALKEGGAPLAVGLLMAAFVRAPLDAKAGKNANELPTRSTVTTSTDSLVVSVL